MNIFKRNSISPNSKEPALIEVINQYKLCQEKVDKINFQYNTNWKEGMVMFCMASLFLFFFMPYFTVSLYLVAFTLRFKYKNWSSKAEKEHQEVVDNFQFFLGENKQEIIKELFQNVKTNELKEMFEKIITKCAMNEYDRELVSYIDNFIYRSKINKDLIHKEEKSNELKNLCKIPLEQKDGYEVPLNIKEKYSEMC